MTKHTKGPWGLYRDGLSVGARSDHTGICEVWGRDGEDCEGRANAKLISAAPELLEALEEVIRTLDGNQPSICDTIWVSNGSPETLYDHCRAAIAKAKGEL